MEAKVYQSRKKYITAAGEVKYYANSTTYKPVDKRAKLKKDDIIKSIREIKDKEVLKRIKEVIDTIKKPEEPVVENV
jgi:hypothetical protein